MYNQYILLCAVRWGNKKPIKFGSPSVTCRPQMIPFRTKKGSTMSPRHPPAPLSPPNHVLGTSQYHHRVSVCCARKTCSKLSYTENKKEKKEDTSPPKQTRSDGVYTTLNSVPPLVLSNSFPIGIQHLFHNIIINIRVARNVTEPRSSRTCPGQTGRPTRGKIDEKGGSFSLLPQDKHTFFP